MGIITLYAISFVTIESDSFTILVTITIIDLVVVVLVVSSSSSSSSSSSNHSSKKIITSVLIRIDIL